MRISKWLLCLALAVAFAGCGGKRNVGEGAQLDAGKNTGFMVASLTQSGIGTGGMSLRLRGLGKNFYDVRVPVNDLFSSNDWPCREEEGQRAAFCGRVAVLELPADDYEFYSFTGGNVKSRTQMSARFTVPAGKTVYIGNVNINIAPLAVETGPVLGDRRVAFKVTLADMRDRDLPLFHSKYPKVAPDSIVFGLARQ